MKVKSVSDLAFQALEEITDNDDDLWVAHLIYNGESRRTGEIQKIMKRDCCIHYYAVQRILSNLVTKNIIHRIRLGVYSPNLAMILPKMIELLEAEGGKVSGSLD